MGLSSVGALDPMAAKMLRKCHLRGLECAIFSAYQVVEKIEVCVGEYVVACYFRNVDNVSAWAFAGVYGPNINLYGRNCLAFLVGRACLGALVVISMSPAFLAKDKG